MKRLIRRKIDNNSEVKQEFYINQTEQETQKIIDMHIKKKSRREQV